MCIRDSAYLDPNQHLRQILLFQEANWSPTNWTLVTPVYDASGKISALRDVTYTQEYGDDGRRQLTVVTMAARTQPTVGGAP